MNKWNVAAYLRLSSDDGDNAESNSIGNQRSIINQYVKQNKELKNENRLLISRNYRLTNYCEELQDIIMAQQIKMERSDT